MAFRSDGVINWTGLCIVLLFYLIIFWVGVRSAKNQQDDSSDAFLLAGRKLPLWIAMFTMAATWIGGGYINGTAEAAYQSGLVWVQAPWGYGLSLVIGGVFFARKMRRHQFRTMLDPLTQRFGTKATGLFFIPALMGEVFWTAAILTALGTTFSVIIGLDTQTAIIASAVIAMLYTSIGGLWSVAYTDVIQLGLIVIGLFLVIPYLIEGGGGLEEIWTNYQLHFDTSAQLLPDKQAMGNHFWNWMDFALLLILGGIPWQVYFQRVLAAKNEQVAMWLSIFAGVICILMAIPAAFVGIVGATTDWSSMGLQGPDNAASILPYVFQYLTPSVIAMIGLSAIAAAVMSSIDSSMLSASSMAVWNVYKPLYRDTLSREDLFKLMQRSVIIVGCTASFLSLQIESVYDLWYLCSDFVYCLLFPALVVALFDPKANRPGALAGLGVATFLRLGGGEPTLGIPSFLPYPMIEEGVVLFPFRTCAMVMGLATMVIVSRITQKRHPSTPLYVVNEQPSPQYLENQSG